MKKDLIGMRFGRGIVIEKTNKRKKECIVWKLKCDCGKYYEQFSNNLTSGHCRSCGCLRQEANVKSGQKNGKKSYLSKVSDSKEKLINWDFTKNNKNNIFPEDFTIGSAKVVYQKCIICGHEWQSPIRSNKCPVCYDSYGEKLIIQIFNKLDIKFERQKTFEKCRNKIKLRFDFYLPYYNLCIEFNGRIHYEIVEKWGGEERFNNQIKNDKIKRDFCTKNNITLIEIPYWDIDKIEQIIQEKILNK